MSRIPRSLLLAAFALVLVVSFVVARSAGESSSDTVSTATTAPAPAAPTSSSPSTSAAAPPPAPAVPVLRSGSVTKLRATKGEQVRFRVQADKADEVHVHGYDLKRDVAAGRTATFSFEATIEGIFEIEFEAAAEQIGSLRVDP